MKINKSGKKKPFFLRWWFILVVIIVIGGGALSSKASGEKIKWDDIVLGEMLPEPPANKGEIHLNSSEEGLILTKFQKNSLMNMLGNARNMALLWMQKRIQCHMMHITKMDIN